MTDFAIKGKNLKECIDKLEKAPQDFIEAEIQNTIQLAIKEQLAITSFYKYLTSTHKDKVFLTTKNSIIWKDRKVLKQMHKCKLRTMELK